MGEVLVTSLSFAIVSLFSLFEFGNKFSSSLELSIEFEIVFSIFSIEFSRFSSGVITLSELSFEISLFSKLEESSF